jgi:argininosuccinate lyase
MSRFSSPQDPLFRAMNSSVSFDYRLAPYDLAQSVAHARMLASRGIIGKSDLVELERGLAAVRREIDDDSFEVQPDDEDIHMAIERRLTEIVGPVGGKLHTARSRNDQVATDVAMFTRAHALTAKELIRDLMATLVDVAERHVDWAMPGYTHLQRAQPVYLSHHLLAYFWKLRRDGARFDAVMAGAAELPLGAGALAGVNFETDRASLAAELAFPGIAQNSIDAVSNRDFVLDYLAAAATCATHLSQLGAEIVLWSSEEFGFCELPDSFSSGSSIMPQKKNPDAAELLRAKAPRVVGHLSALHGVLHGLPLTYNKDLQEDKEHLFDAVDTLELSLRAAREMLRGISFRRERLAEAAADELLAATDVADLLVRRGVPFREAHGIVAGLVRRALDRGATLSELTEDELAELAPQLGDGLVEVLSEGAWLESKASEGGTALARVREQLDRAREALAGAEPA